MGGYKIMGIDVVYRIEFIDGQTCCVTTSEFKTLESLLETIHNAWEGVIKVEYIGELWARF
jgi:hypothetical protein